MMPDILKLGNIFRFKNHQHSKSSILGFCHFTQRNKEISLELLAALLRVFFFFLAAAAAAALQFCTVYPSGGAFFLSPTLKKCQNSA